MSANEYELPWTGKPFSAPFLAFDTETAVVDPSGREYDLTREIQPLVLATVSDGERSAVLYPRQLPDFIWNHRSTLLVGHNFQFDFWAVHQCLGDSPKKIQWKWMADDGLFDDTMLLDFLVRLASGRADGAEYRTLGKLAPMVGMVADKESDYRLRFHEIIGKDFWKVDRGFFEYSIADAAVTWHVYKHLQGEAIRLSREAGVPVNDRAHHGLLTSKLQTRASIVLSEVGRNGMRVDKPKLSAVREKVREETSGLIRYLSTYYPPVFDTFREKKRAGQFKLTPTGLPRLRYDSLRVHLEQVARERGINKAFLPKTPKTGELGTSLDPWRSLAGDSPLIQRWGRLADLSKVLQFTAQLDGLDSVNPSFKTLVRTGRTSCRSPNIQQMPRESWFRELFVPRPGHSFVIVDYSAIELTTLAAVLLNRYGKSVLADVLRAGRKPHEYTAALVMGMSYEDFCEGLKREKESGEGRTFKDARQAAKAINFGVPGGLGAKKLSVYAKTNYGVEMGEEEAKRLRDKLTKTVYPELSLYLDDNPFEAIARNLGCTEQDLDGLFEVEDQSNRRLQGRLIDDVISRGGKSKKGHHYPLSWRQKVWQGLQRLNRNPALVQSLSTWESNMHARLAITGQSVTTLTGRVRAGVDYGEARNTPFQGLAADGAKVALWRLYRAGYRIANFVHDEIVVEVSDGENAEWHLAEVSRIMKESMQSVLLCDLPVEVEGQVSKCWAK